MFSLDQVPADIHLHGNDLQALYQFEVPPVVGEQHQAVAQAGGADEQVHVANTHSCLS